MILPNNGKVVIIDDDPKDVKELMLALTKERMPFLLFQDLGGDDLPPNNNPIENIRLVFLDLDLGIGGLGDIEMIRIVQGRIVRIIKQHTPYVLVLWSNHEGRLAKTLFEEFDNGFKDYKPIAHCSLDKTILNRGQVVETIRQELKTCLASFQSFNAFLLWESAVNTSAGIITNNLTNIFERNNDWDKNFCNLLFSLSKAQVGDDSIKDLKNEEKLLSAFEIINSTLIENIEIGLANRVNEISISEIKLGGQGIKDIEKDKINTSIHLLKSNSLNHFFSGNLYELNSDEIKNEIIKHNFKESKLKDIGNSTSTLVCLDITPACDYSRRKNYTRILFGVQIIGNFKKTDLKQEDSNYKLVPVMELEASSYIMFDYRHFQTFSKLEFENIFKEKPKYRLRNNLLLDIQAQLSNHINRPGIVNI